MPYSICNVKLSWQEEFEDQLLCFNVMAGGLTIKLLRQTYNL